MRIVRLASAALVALLVVGCKLEINVPAEGGTVTTLSGNYNCGAGRACVIDVNDTSFDEKFLAEPADGYIFVGWKKAESHFCGNKNSTCNLATDSFAGNALLMSFLTGSNADKTFYLEPVFEPRVTGGGAWIGQATYCAGWGEGDPNTGTTNDPDRIGVAYVDIDTEGYDCRDYETYAFEESPTTGEPRLFEIRPPITKSAQCPDDPDCGRTLDLSVYSYISLQSQGVFVDRVSRFDTYTFRLGDGASENGEIDESLVWGYESSSQSQRRPNKFEVFERIENPDTEQLELKLTQRALWDYEDDGRVSQASLSLYDESIEDYLNGRIRYVLESDGLAEYTDIDFQGQTFTLSKIVYHDRGLLDTPTPTLTVIPSGQVGTENDWELPENYTEYTVDDEFALVPELKEEITKRSNVGNLPLEMILSTWDPASGQWVESGKTEFGYRVDGEGSFYLIMELNYSKEPGGNWEKVTAGIYSYRTDPYNIAPQ